MTDREFTKFVNQAINSGAKEIAIPADILASADKETIRELRRLCELNGVKIKAVRD